MLLSGSTIHGHSWAALPAGERGRAWIAATRCSDSRLQGLALPEAVSQMLDPCLWKSLASPKETPWVQCLGGMRMGLSLSWCIRWQKAIPASRAARTILFLGLHFSVSGFKQRQMRTPEDMDNEPAPSGSPVTHTVPAPGRWCHSPCCQCLSRTHGRFGIAAMRASTTKKKVFYFLVTYPHLSKSPSELPIRQGKGAFLLLRAPRAFQVYLVSHAFVKTLLGCLPVIMWKIARGL